MKSGRFRSPQNWEGLNDPLDCNSGLKNSINLKLGKEVLTHLFCYVEKIHLNV